MQISQREPHSLSLFLNFRTVKANGAKHFMFKKWICKVAVTDYSRLFSKLIDEQ